MKAKYIDIILEALNDYRLWFADQEGDTPELEADIEKCKLIDEAINYIEERE